MSLSSPTGGMLASSHTARYTHQLPHYMYVNYACICMYVDVCIVCMYMNVCVDVCEWTRSMYVYVCMYMYVDVCIHECVDERMQVC